MAYSAERRAKMREFLRAVKDRVLEPEDPSLVMLADQAANEARAARTRPRLDPGW